MKVGRVSFGTRVKRQHRIYGLQSLMEQGQTTQLCRGETGETAGQIVRVGPDLGQEIEKDVARSRGDFVHEVRRGTSIIRPLGRRASADQVGF